MGEMHHEPTFEGWLEHVFDHPVTDPAWHWSWDADPWHDGSQGTLPFLTRLFEDPGVLPDRFTPEQINQGLWYLAGDGNDFLRSVLDEAIPWADRRRCVMAIATLFDGLFAKVCTDHLSHLDRGPSPPAPVNPVNLACYMWWDLFPSWGEPGDPSRAELDGVVLAVLRTILHLPSTPCRESALHGLGHWQMHYPAQVEHIIDEFLHTGGKISPELRAYALNARRGYIL